MHSRIRALTVGAATAALLLAGGGVAAADPGIGVGGAAGGSSASQSEDAGRVLPARFRVGYKDAAGRSLYTIERQRGYSPQQARYLAQRIVDRIYPGAWWADGTNRWARGIYVPLWDSVFYYR